MCTVVFDLAPGAATPLRMLAIRDEFTGRPFDPPGRHWPQWPTLVGGRDRQAGGTWCVTDTATGWTAAVLNRTEKRAADPGAPSRGELPLAAVVHGAAWPSHVVTAGMASFNLLLLTGTAARLWTFDGTTLAAVDLAPGSHMVTPLGADLGDLDPRWGRWMDGLAEVTGDTEAVWTRWLALLRSAPPSDDPSAIIVRRELPDGRVYGTVFGQLIAAAPGHVRVDWSLTPSAPTSWTSEQWT